MKHAKIVVGAAFGDEGKGRTVNYLAAQSLSKGRSTLVVRFNGGHQAGHAVSLSPTKKHIFSSYGSATNLEVPTYISWHCVFNPVAIINEYNTLKNNGISYIPKLLISPNAKLTTMYDIEHNRRDISNLSNGTCGVGVGSTMRRNDCGISMSFSDLLDVKRRNKIFENIKKFYNCVDNDILEEKHKLYLKAYEDFLDIVDTVDLKHDSVLDDYDEVIFEGAQGIMLDSNFGTYPHVTWSHTTSRNALNLVRSRIDMKDIEIYYVTRTYQTRHGNGPMTNTQIPILSDCTDETNVTNEYQGSFRKAILDIDMLKYAIRCDKLYSQECVHNFVLTCIDQVYGKENLNPMIEMMHNGQIKRIFCKEVPDYIGTFKTILFSHGSQNEDIV